MVSAYAPSRFLWIVLAAAVLLMVGCGGGEENGASVALSPASAPGAADAAARASTALPPRDRGLLPPSVTAAALAIMDDESGAVIYARDARVRHAPASVTKIATAVVVLEAGDIDRTVTVNTNPSTYLATDSTTMGLERGDRLTVRDLLYGLMLASGNDAADALAVATSGNEDAFVERMNQLARRLGLRDTHFSDPHGLGGPNHYTTAYDLAVISRYAMSLPEFRDIVGTEQITIHASRDYSLYNHNPLLNYTPGVDGIKTGFTEAAGRTFVLSAKRNGHRIHIVMLDAPLRAQDAIALVEWAFSNFEWPTARVSRD